MIYSMLIKTTVLLRIWFKTSSQNNCNIRNVTFITFLQIASDFCCICCQIFADCYHHEISFCCVFGLFIKFLYFPVFFAIIFIFHFIYIFNYEDIITIYSRCFLFYCFLLTVIVVTKHMVLFSKEFWFMVNIKAKTRHLLVCFDKIKKPESCILEFFILILEFRI